jgi:hypothetical protein
MLKFKDASIIFFVGSYQRWGHLWKPSGVFTSKMSAIFVPLIQIRPRLPGRYLILIDSMSSLKALQTIARGLLVAEEQCVWNSNAVDPVTCGGKGNDESADQLASVAVENGIKWQAPVRPYDVLPLSRLSFFVWMVAEAFWSQSASGYWKVGRVAGW